MATSNIEKQAFGQAGATIALPATGAVTGDFCALAFIRRVHIVRTDMERTRRTSW